MQPPKTNKKAEMRQATRSFYADDSVVHNRIEQSSANFTNFV